MYLMEIRRKPYRNSVRKRIMLLYPMDTGASPLQIYSFYIDELSGTSLLFLLETLFLPIEE